MTGTISQVNSNSAGMPVAVGDRVAWTLQYDRSMPGSPMNPNAYSPNTPTILHLVDLSSMTSLPTPPNVSNPGGQTLFLLPGSLPAGGDGAFLTGTTWTSGLNIGAAHLELSNIFTKQPLPTTDLTKLQLDKVPFDERTLYYDYTEETLVPLPGVPGLMTSLVIVADPLTAPVSSAPEPGALTLFIVGSVGLVARRLQVRFGCHRHGGLSFVISSLSPSRSPRPPSQPAPTS